MNLVILSGKVANKYDNGGNVRLTIAEKYKQNTQFISVTTFGNTANFVRTYVNIGDAISIEGRMDTFKGNDGKERLSIVANTVNFEGYQRPKERVQNNPYVSATMSGTKDMYEHYYQSEPMTFEEIIGENNSDTIIDDLIK